LYLLTYEQLITAMVFMISLKLTKNAKKINFKKQVIRELFLRVKAATAFGAS